MALSAGATIMVIVVGSAGVSIERSDDVSTRDAATASESGLESARVWADEFLDFCLVLEADMGNQKKTTGA